jgi:translation initiation factor 2D
VQYGVDSTTFANEVSKRFACAHSKESNPEGRPALPKGCSECVFQGNLSQELQAFLTGDESLSNHGGSKGADHLIPKSVIEVKLRKGVSSKKNR